VLIAARAKGRFARAGDDALVTEILAGVPTRELPRCVREALAGLDEHRITRSQKDHALITGS
jgi:hypothetical protein